MRFKVGDKVRVKKFKERPSTWNSGGKMDHLMGKVVKIERVVSPTKCVYAVYDSQNDYDWFFREDDLEPVNETIVIYSKDREVIALDKRTGKKAIAKCSPEDTFDFNIGAKLAFDRLMNGNKENITIEDMRKRLELYCSNRSCSDCKLKSPTCRCGCGAHFMTKDKAGNYTMSDEEIKDAYNIVFDTGVKEVKRHAKVGEYVKIVDAECLHGNYRNGDILKIIDDMGHVRYSYNPGEFLYDKEYAVLEGYKLEKDVKPKEPHKFKVGDIVKGNSESGRRYLVTNDNMTRGKVISATGVFITIEVLSHKTMPEEVVEEYVGLESKYFDLVEETPKLYNGKIIFTKGDSIFKTGHIYEVEGGRISTDKYGWVPLEEALKDIEDVKDYFTGNCDGNRKREYGWAPYTLELMEVKED